MGKHVALTQDDPLVERLLSAHGVVSVLHSPPGFGKTMLLQKARQTLLQRGFPVVESLEEAESMPSFPWLLLDDRETHPLDAGRLRRAVDQAHVSHSGIIIATRQLQPLPIARLRAEGRVLRLGPQQIGISQSNAFAILHTVLEKKPAAWLANQIDGWSVAAALLVDYASDVGARFGEDGKFLTASGLAAYIDQEILGELPPAWRGALLFASVFKSCDPTMLDFIRPHDDLGRLLAPLHEHLDGLVGDHEGQTTLNPLFRLHLTRLFEQLPQSERADVLERASRCCARSGRAVEAARLVTRTGNSEAIIDFVRRSKGLRLWATAGTDVVREIVAQAGTRGIHDEPRLKLLQCLVHMKDGQIDVADRLLTQITPQVVVDEQVQIDAAIVRVALMIYGCKPISDADLAEVRNTTLRGGEDPAWDLLILQMQSIIEMQRGNLDGAVAAIVDGVRSATAANSEYALLFLDIHNANVALARGDLLPARAWLSQARKVWRRTFPDDVGVQTILDALTANLEFEAGRLSSARINIRRATHHMPHVEAWLDIYAAAYEPMARLLIVDVGLASTLANLRAQHDALIISGLPRVAKLLKALETCLVGEANLRNIPIDLQNETPRPVGADVGASWQEREVFTLAEAYSHLASGNDAAAERALTALIEFAQPRGIFRSVLRSWLLLVAVLDQRGDNPGADALFDKALSLGARTGMVRAFAEIGGEAVKRRCRERLSSLRNPSSTDPIRLRLLRTLARWEESVLPKRAARLTPRETDVLGGMELGGADKVVARRLGMTEYAVRFHLRSLYKKLGASDRVGLLVCAREAGLLT